LIDQLEQKKNGSFVLVVDIFETRHRSQMKYQESRIKIGKIKFFYTATERFITIHMK